MNNDPSRASLVQPPPTETSLGEAVCPGKEAWKNEPGNRYTPEEFREMKRQWNVQVINPNIPHCCRAD